MLFDTRKRDFVNADVADVPRLCSLYQLQT